MMVDLKKVLEVEKQIRLECKFSCQSSRKLFFLATCKTIYEDCNIDEIDRLCPFGGIIGIGDSHLEQILGGFKLFRLHAMIHDACGFIRSNYQKGPGYAYLFPQLPDWLNCCLLGHVTGILYCIYLKFFQSVVYKKLDL